MFFIKKDKQINDPRREFLVRALTVGAFAASGAMGLLLPLQARASSIFGKMPRKVPDGKSFFSIEGDVRVNGEPATEDTVVQVSDTVLTGDKSQAVFVVGKDAFILRSNSELKLAGSGALLTNMRLLTGKLLSVFGKRGKKDPRLALVSPTATIGIRGTGVYMESEPDLTYLCTCYGVVNMSSIEDPASQETIAAQHHDAPRYILAKGEAGKRIRPAPMLNHEDIELLLIEELVGRTPPFDVKDAGYSAPRRGY
ncbi:MAG TPA: hypothetical protein VFX02_02095 [Gammaproteobacteria bacterium]|nr:hypothetical protein [Gammaproteobacteria bacterium]